MAHEFVIIRKGIQETYTKYDDIPLDLDHVIKFLPEIPPPPHTHEQHKEIDSWTDKLQRLIVIENQNARNS